MFVNFAKEQTDDDCLTEVLIGNGTVQSYVAVLPTNIRSPVIQTQQLVSPPVQVHSKKREAETSSDRKKKGKEGKSKKTKSASSSKGKWKKGKSSKEKSSSTSTTVLPQPLEEEEMHQKNRKDSNLSDGCDVGPKGDSSINSRSKDRPQWSSKDPSALFIVSSNTQDSTLWGGYEHQGFRHVWTKYSSYSTYVHLIVYQCRLWKRKKKQYLRQNT